jgi:hypothetical protein
MIINQSLNSLADEVNSQLMFAFICLFCQFMVKLSYIFGSEKILKGIKDYNDKVKFAEMTNNKLIFLGGNKFKIQRISKFTTIDKLVNYFATNFIVFALCSIFIRLLYFVNEQLYTVCWVIFIAIFFLEDFETEWMTPLIDKMQSVIFAKYTESISLVVLFCVVFYIYIYWKDLFYSFFIYVTFGFILIVVMSAIRAYYMHDRIWMLLVYLLTLIISIFYILRNKNGDNISIDQMVKDH